MTRHHAILATLSLILGLLLGCGTITESSTDIPPVRGEVPLDPGNDIRPSEGVMKDVASADGGEADSQPEGVDGGTVDSLSEVAVSPVCPVGLTCDVTSAACRALCPTCTEVQDGKCVSDGFCVCR